MVAPIYEDTYDEDLVNVNEDPVNMDDEEEEDDPEEKERLVRVLSVFFMRLEYGDGSHVDNFQKATPEFSRHIRCVENIRTIGEAFVIARRKLRPSVLRKCGL